MAGGSELLPLSPRFLVLSTKNLRIRQRILVFMTLLRGRFGAKTPWRNGSKPSRRRLFGQVSWLVRWTQGDKTGPKQAHHRAPFP